MPPAPIQRPARRLATAAVAGFLAAAATAAGCWYYLTPQYALAGYMPAQGASFSHAVHAGRLGMDCRACHPDAERADWAGLPPSAKCINCHAQALKNDPRLARVRQSAASGAPVPWTRVHRLPDFVVFSHGAHTRRGVGCRDCHGAVETMEETRQTQGLSMAFCLDCHRNPAPALRPLGQTVNPLWTAPEDPAAGARLARQRETRPPVYCGGCHR